MKAQLCMVECQKNAVINMHNLSINTFRSHEAANQFLAHVLTHTLCHIFIFIFHQLPNRNTHTEYITPSSWVLSGDS
jgi:predicted SprT family Zn-dependent metalloprotease